MAGGGGGCARQVGQFLILLQKPGTGTWSWPEPRPGQVPVVVAGHCSSPVNTFLAGTLCYVGCGPQKWSLGDINGVI